MADTIPVRRRLAWLVVALALLQAGPACEELVEGAACPEGGACEAPGEACGFSGAVCEVVVDCCAFVDTAAPQSPAAGACSLDRSVAAAHFSAGQPHHGDCQAALSKSAYAGLCTGCAP